MGVFTNSWKTFILACPAPFSTGPGVVLLMQFYDKTPGTIVSGTSVADLSGSGHHGTMSANAQFVRSSDSCQAVGLYVNAGGINIPNVPSLRLNGPLTLEIWAKAHKLGYGYIVLLEGSYGFPKYGYGSFKIFVDRDSRDFTSIEESDLDIHYFVLMVTPTENKVYIDGRLVHSGRFLT